MEMMEDQQNALSPILVTLLGMVKEVREHHAKAPSPMLVTLLGIVREVREEHLEKADPAICLIPSGIVYAPSKEGGI